MFARTRRLTLRPRWPEDDAALAAIGYDETVMQSPPAPSADGDLDATTDCTRDIGFMICAHEGASPSLIGSIALIPRADSHELRFWLTSDSRGRGYATEAAAAVLDIARHALPIRRLTAAPASCGAGYARVLRKLGFRDGERREFRASKARVRGPEATMMELDLADQRPAMPIAA